MDYSALERLEEKTYRSIAELADAQGGFSPAEIEHAKCAVCLLNEIEKVRTGNEIELSMRGGMRSGRMWDDGMRNDIYSGARRARDSEGRYTSMAGYNEGSNRRGYSGYDGGGENTVYSLEMLMNSTTNESDKRVLSDALSRLQRR